ncbi:hypothetical protein [Actinomyces massiliensis]|uniref:hypothetical protein n=1 Tax=Actinomyces massiliensis TaxID=461393 RepID=UPI0028E260BD|nr:hypothetical protein [Actinomyces massiliensis]
MSPARRPGPPTAIESHRALRRAVARIDASFHERVALDRLARHAPVTCPRSYPQQVGMAFSEDLTRVRLRRETRDLGGTGHRIAQIAVDSGVPDVKALNTAFRPHLRAHAPAFRRLLTADAAATGRSSTSSATPLATTRRSCGPRAPGPHAPPPTRRPPAR